MIRVDRLLMGFGNDKKGVRVVVDEFGGFVGLIGAEAVLAVLAGWWRKSGWWKAIYQQFQNVADYISTIGEEV